MEDSIPPDFWVGWGFGSASIVVVFLIARPIAAFLREWYDKLPKG
jgi:hypothetical protein